MSFTTYRLTVVDQYITSVLHYIHVKLLATHIQSQKYTLHEQALGEKAIISSYPDKDES